jgi:hypothetical protein
MGISAASSILVSPDHPANHADFDKASDTNFQALSSARKDDAGIKLAKLAALAPHMPFDVPKGNVTDKLCKVAGQIVPSDVAVPASNTNELPDFMRKAQGLHISARSAAQFRHHPN